MAVVLMLLQILSKVCMKVGPSLISPEILKGQSCMAVVHGSNLYNEKNSILEELEFTKNLQLVQEAHDD